MSEETYTCARCGQKHNYNEIAPCGPVKIVPTLNDDKVNHPPHYQQVPGIECIDVVEHFNFNRGNAIKYLWRAGDKGNLVEDLKKAMWYIQREIDNATNTVRDN